MNTTGRTEQAIQEIVDRETHAWDTRDVELLMTIFHPDMVWPWPPTSSAHDPMEWVLELGRFDHDRWRAGWQKLFDTHELVHEAEFTLENIEVDLKRIMSEFWSNEELRTCKSTGSVIAPPTEAVAPPPA